ncbi:hypothetical protein H7H78_00050 [Mycobacterium shinjukuense]|nr:hypothetical protein [Mycobacterium shinjukuense]MCV6983908.1 hypothetical protein [Mycobacterium shinjukuense]
MRTPAATDTGAHVVVFAMTVLVGFAAMVPARWHAAARRASSYAVYYIGYRLLSVQLTCGPLAVSGIPLVIRHP